MNTPWRAGFMICLGLASAIGRSLWLGVRGLATGSQLMQGLALSALLASDAQPPSATVGEALILPSVLDVIGLTGTDAGEAVAVPVNEAFEKAFIAWDRCGMIVEAIAFAPAVQWSEAFRVPGDAGLASSRSLSQRNRWTNALFVWLLFVWSLLVAYSLSG